MVQQQNEVHAEVRVAIEALDYEYNHNARTQSPRLSAARLWLAAGVDAGSGLETKKGSAPSARLSWLRIIRECTQQQQQQQQQQQ